MHFRLSRWLFLVLLVLGGNPAWAQVSELKVKEAPEVLLRAVPYSLKLENPTANSIEMDLKLEGLQIEGDRWSGLTIEPGEELEIEVRTLPGSQSTWSLSASAADGSMSEKLASGRVLSAWLALIPPAIAIGVALISKQVLLALILGIFSGGILVSGAVLPGFAMTLDQFLVNSLADKDHAFILLFTMSLGGMVALVSASGGMQGLVESMSRWAKTPASTQVATWAMGVAIFFDDYANTLLVGQTMRPVTDKHRISREKLAYLVDSTAAPIASIALVSTWIGYEMSLISASLQQVGIDRNVYEVFLESILHRYYAIYALIFVLAVAWMHRDFGPMLKAERRAAAGQLSSESGSNLEKPAEFEEATWGRSAWDAVLPVGTVLFGTILGLAITGYQELGALPEANTSIGAFARLVTEGNSFKALLWASVAGGILSALISKIRYRVSLEKLTEVYMKGVTHMVMACVVLVLAWAIGDVCEKVGTGLFLVELSRGLLSPTLLPTVTFLLAAVVAFSTGTSWATMAIVMPLAVRLSYQLPLEVGLSPEATDTILIATIASVLAGATFGDHCSPISDTTIMSSVASGCHHIDHVRTQIPYALTTAGLAVFLGTLPAAYAINPWILNLLGIIAVVLVVRFVGEPVLEPKESDNS